MFCTPIPPGLTDTRAITICLRTIRLCSTLLFREQSAPTKIWVARLWGLPRSTLFVSKKTTSLWHFQS